MAFDFDAMVERIALLLATVPENRRGEGLRIVRAKVLHVASLAEVEEEETRQFVNIIMRNIEERMRKLARRFH